MNSLEENVVPVITCYEDMEQRARFVPVIDPTVKKLRDILAEYHLATEILCGLEKCREGHKHGLLIITEDGTETAIGADCGAREFPDRFDNVRKSFRIRRAQQTHLGVIEMFKELAPGYIDQVTAMWNEPLGGSWAHQSRSYFMQTIPRSLLAQLTGMAKTGNWTIWQTVKIDSDNALSLGYRADADEKFEHRKLGTFRGGPALMKSCWDALHPLLKAIKQRKEQSAKSLSSVEQRKWAEWALTIPTLLAEAETLIKLSRECFQADNIQQLAPLARKKDETKALNKLIRQFDAAPSPALRDAG